MKKYFIVCGMMILLSIPCQTFSGILGDINSDGQIDLREAIYALQIVAGIRPQNGNLFTSADLAGTWEFTGLISGDYPNEAPGWYYGNWSIDDSGNMTSLTPITNSLGKNTEIDMSNTNVTISPSGVVILNNDPGMEFRGVMNKAKNLIAITSTMRPGNSNDICGYNLLLFFKNGAIYHQSDLSGTWEYVGLISGDSPNQRPGWYYGVWSIDNDGNMSTTTPVTDSLGNNTWVPTGESVSLSTSGIVTFDNDPGLQFRGVMNQGKNIIAITSTMCPGNSLNICGYNFLLFLKKGATYRQTDLTGTWEYVGLISGDSPNQRPGWYYGDWLIDNDGNMRTSTPITDSLGNNTWVPTGGSVSLSSSGIFTLDNDPTLKLRGVMNAAKNVIAFTSTMCPGNPNDICGYNLGLYLKK